MWGVFINLRNPHNTRCRHYKTQSFPLFYTQNACVNTSTPARCDVSITPGQHCDFLTPHRAVAVFRTSDLESAAATDAKIAETVQWHSADRSFPLVIAVQNTESAARVPELLVKVAVELGWPVLTARHHDHVLMLVARLAKFKKRGLERFAGRKNVHLLPTRATKSG
jgi:hypothetical protein